MNEVFPKCERKSAPYHFNNVFLQSPLLCDRFHLYQIGELYCGEEEVIRPHKQFCAELTFVISGRGTITTDQVTTQVEKNDCYVSFLNDVHGINSSGKPALRYFFCGFNPADERTEALIRSIRHKMYEEQTRTVRLPELAPMFHSQLTEIQNRTPYSCESIGLLLYRMLIMIYRSLNRETVPTPEYYADNQSALVYQMMAYVDENIATLTKLTDLESVFYFKYRYLEKCFLSITGTTLSEYFRQRKMQVAARELAHGAGVTQVAEKLNFSSIHSFSRAFSSFYGISPSLYRKQQEKKENSQKN